MVIAWMGDDLVSTLLGSRSHELLLCCRQVLILSRDDEQGRGLCVKENIFQIRCSRCPEKRPGEPCAKGIAVSSCRVLDDRLCAYRSEEHNSGGLCAVFEQICCDECAQ